MAIKPILFNTEMVRAILDGKKTCTRRIVKGAIPDDAMWGYTMFTPKGYISCRGTFPVGYGEKFFKLPYQKGDILYVRETWQFLYELDGNEQPVEETGKYYYAATDITLFNTYVDENGAKHDYVPWRPSIHMPKEAARIWLKVTDVRAERLKELTEDGAKAEGANQKNGKNVGWEEKMRRTAIERFAEIWNSTIKKSDLDRYGWDANPWVWVIEFERCEKPKEE
nr:hypothetical protein [uncultured Anaerotignum sp.]